jgi:hypothetical protein
MLTNLSEMCLPRVLTLAAWALFVLGSGVRGASAERPPLKTLARGSTVKLEWRIDWEPPTRIHRIKVVPVNWSTNDVIRWARYFCLTNNCEPLPGNFISAPGWWIRDFTDTRRLNWRATCFSQRENCLSYTSGDDGYRWDLKRQEPLFRSVPSRDEAVLLAEWLIKELGVEVSWARRANGQLLTSQRVHGTGFYRPGSTNYEEVVQQQGVYLYQKVGDGTLLGDEQGAVLVRFVSDRKVSDVEVRVVRELETIAVPAVSKAEINEAVGKGNTWIRPNLNLGTTVEVIGAEIVYPATGRWKSETLRPFYRLHVRKQGDREKEFLFVEAIQ